jgi:hypothetical protein
MDSGVGLGIKRVTVCGGILLTTFFSQVPSSDDDDLERRQLHLHKRRSEDLEPRRCKEGRVNERREVIKACAVLYISCSNTKKEPWEPVSIRKPHSTNAHAMPIGYHKGSKKHNRKTKTMPSPREISKPSNLHDLTKHPHNVSGSSLPGWDH